MCITDPISDMLTKIRNGQASKKTYITTMRSNVKLSILEVLKNEGYIESFGPETVGDNSSIKVNLKYYKGMPVIEAIEKISKPSLRVYSNYLELLASSSLYGIKIVSTSKGLMTDKNAIENRIGGEVICSVF